MQLLIYTLSTCPGNVTNATQGFSTAFDLMYLTSWKTSVISSHKTPSALVFSACFPAVHQFTEKEDVCELPESKHGKKNSLCQNQLHLDVRIPKNKETHIMLRH
jgi:hypothetical protein